MSAIAGYTARLRFLAKTLSGTRLEPHVEASYQGPVRMVGVSIVDEDGDEVDLGLELLLIADGIDTEADPIVKPE